MTYGISPSHFDSPLSLSLSFSLSLSLSLSLSISLSISLWISISRDRSEGEAEDQSVSDTGWKEVGGDVDKITLSEKSRSKLGKYFSFNLAFDTQTEFRLGISPFRMASSAVCVSSFQFWSDEVNPTVRQPVRPYALSTSLRAGRSNQIRQLRGLEGPQYWPSGGQQTSTEFLFRNIKTESQKNAIFSAFSRFCLDISKNKFRTCFLTAGRPIIRDF